MSICFLSLGTQFQEVGARILTKEETEINLPRLKVTVLAWGETVPRSVGLQASTLNH